MKEFKGTKGPWVSSNNGYYFEILPAGSLQSLCSTTHNHYIGIDEEIEEHNANLIAAAPELLDLLIWLVDIEGPQPGHSEWASRVNATIAKALGESK